MAVDLTEIPELPSIFNVDKRSERDALIFLKSFVAAIAAPIAKDGRQHVDYVPSQIMCEYLYQKMNLGTGKRIGALLYPSSLDPGGVNIVIFPPRSVLDDWESLIEFRSNEIIAYDNWKDFQQFLS